MVTDNHYRWDFIGLSTDEKPTPATSEKVVDGSTFYCSDTSKLYVYCKNNWYERKPLGSGGGTSYTAGDGITIADDTVSVDTTTIQEKLTAGTGIDITNNTISATGGGGGITTLTSADYNYHSSGSTDDGVALWLLDEGQYIIEAETGYYTSTGSRSYPQQNTGVVILVKPTGTGSNERGGFILQENTRTVLVSRIDSTGNNGNQDVLPRNVANNLTTTASGYALDARQGKVLKDLIDALDARVTALEGN